MYMYMYMYTVHVHAHHAAALYVILRHVTHFSDSTQKHNANHSTLCHGIQYHTTAAQNILRIIFDRSAVLDFVLSFRTCVFDDSTLE